MKVGSLAWPWVASVAPSDRLEQAVWRMRQFDVGCVAVVEDDALVGIVTERDLLRASAEGISPRSVTVRDYMSHSPVTVDIDEDVGEAAAVMIALGARHLPVVSDGEVVGVLSVRDLLPFITDGRVVDLARRRAQRGRLDAPHLGKRRITDR